MFVVVVQQRGELTNRNLLAMAVGLKQKDNVDAVVKKVSFLCLCQ